MYCFSLTLFFNAWSKYLMCTTYVFLSLRFGTSFCTFPIFIISTKKWQLWDTLLKPYPFLVGFIKFIYFSWVESSTFHYANPSVCSFVSLPSCKWFLRLNTEDMCLPRQDCIAFYILIIRPGIAFNCLSNPSSDASFKYQQHVYVCKQLKPKLV